MRENVRTLLARLAKWGAIGSLAVITGVIAFHFFFRKPVSVRVPASPAEASPRPGQAVDRKEGIEHVLFKGDTGKIKIKADKFYVGEDKLNHLEGNVEVVDYGRKGGRETHISADRVDYNPEMTHFQAAGRASVRDADALIESSSLTYDKDGEVFQTDQGVTFSTSRLQARGRAFVYRKRNELLELEGDIAVEIKPKDKITRPLTVTGDSFSFRRRARLGRIEGGVDLVFGKSRGSADKLTFQLTRNEQEIRSITLQGAGKAVFYREDVEAQSSVPQEIQAEEIWMLAYPAEQTISRLRVKGGSVLHVSLSPGSSDEIIADSAILYFDRKGSLSNFLAAKAVRMKIGAGKEDEEKRISGDRVIFHRKDGFLRTVGNPKVPARIDTARTEIEAQMVQVNMDSGDLGAMHAVKLLLKPGRGGESVGFFAKDKPVFITSGTMKYEKARKLFSFKEDVRIWQDRDVVLAKEFDINEDTGEVFGRNGVTAGFTRKPAEGRPEERLTITSEAMAYFPKEKRIGFTGGCTLVSPEIHMTSVTLDIRFKEDGQEMDRMLAKGKILIVQEKKEGRGEEAVYDLKAETVVLTGNPVLIDKDKGVTEGDKLTFDLSNDKILIENKEKDRSATVIKS
jgi:lipopolysaccharide transport protein LptA